MLEGLRSRWTIPAAGHEAFNDLHTDLEQPLRSVDPPERRAVDELHDEVIRPDVVELADVGIVQGGDRPGFAFEPLGKLRPADLDGDDPIEAGVFGPVHIAHATRSDSGQNLVRSEASAGGQRHVRGSVGIISAAAAARASRCYTSPIREAQRMKAVVRIAVATLLAIWFLWYCSPTVAKQVSPKGWTTKTSCYESIVSCR